MLHVAAALRGCESPLLRQQLLELAEQQQLEEVVGQYEEMRWLLKSRGCSYGEFGTSVQGLGVGRLPTINIEAV